MTEPNSFWDSIFRRRLRRFRKKASAQKIVRTYNCDSCVFSFAAHDYVTRCPRCGSDRVFGGDAWMYV